MKNRNEDIAGFFQKKILLILILGNCFKMDSNIVFILCKRLQHLILLNIKPAKFIGFDNVSSFKPKN